MSEPPVRIMSSKITTSLPATSPTTALMRVSGPDAALHRGVAEIGDDEDQRAGAVLAGGAAEAVDFADARAAVGGRDEDDVLIQQREAVGDIETQIVLAVGEGAALDVSQRHA